MFNVLKATETHIHTESFTEIQCFLFCEILCLCGNQMFYPLPRHVNGQAIINQHSSIINLIDP